MEDAHAAGCTFFLPHAAFFEDAQKHGIKAGIDGLVGVAFGDGLHAGAAADGEDGVDLVDLVGGLFDEDVVALTFDSQFVDRESEALQPAGHAQGAGRWR